jgi:magnesium-transporting ATPase (P-type)
MTIVFALMLGLSLPITPVQILWVNMITAVTLGLALAFEPTEDHTMQRPPRPRDQPLISGELLWHIVLVAGLFMAGIFGIYEYSILRGYSENLARTIALNTLVALEIFHLFFIRNMHRTSLTWRLIRGTRVLWLSISAVIAGQGAITYVPLLQGVFETEAIGLLDGLLIAGIGLLLFFIIEIEKQIRLRVLKTAF